MALVGNGTDGKSWPFLEHTRISPTHPPNATFHIFPTSQLVIMLKTLILGPLVLLAVLVHPIMVLAQPINMQDVRREISQAAGPPVHAFERRDNSLSQWLRKERDHQQQQEYPTQQQLYQRLQNNLNQEITAYDQSRNANVSRDHLGQRIAAVERAMQAMVNMEATRYRGAIQRMWDDVLQQDVEAMSAASVANLHLHNAFVIADMRSLIRATQALVDAHETPESERTVYLQEIRTLEDGVRRSES